MRTIEEVERAFAVGWDGVPESWGTDRLKTELHEMALSLWHHLPNGPEKTLALRTLWRLQCETQLSLCLSAAPVAE